MTDLVEASLPAKIEEVKEPNVEETPKIETKVEEAKVEEAKVEETKVEETKVEETKVEKTKVEEAKVEETKVEETKVEEAKVEEAKVDETKVEEAKVEETKVEETKVEETKVEETKVEETKVEETKVEEKVEEVKTHKKHKKTKKSKKSKKDGKEKSENLSRNAQSSESLEIVASSVETATAESEEPVSKPGFFTCLKNKFRGIPSTASSIPVVAPTTPVVPPSISRRALLIGINYIGTGSQLNGCINDVINIKNFLKTEFGLLDSDIRLMTDDASTPDNLKPTKANIIEGFKWLTTGVKADAKLFIHYSGHGTQMRELSAKKDENDGYDEAICPCDYSTSGFIIDDDLRTNLVNSLPAKGQLFSIFDCCHSGTILDLKYDYLYKPTARKDIFELGIEKLESVSPGSAIMLSGCLDPQTSADAFINGKSQGAMTYAFLMGYNTLKAQKQTITCQNVLKSLTGFIKSGGYTQVPKLSTGTLIAIDAPLKIF